MQRGRVFSRDYGNERSLQRPECTGLHGTKRQSQEKRDGLTFKYAKIIIIIIKVSGAAKSTTTKC